MRIVNSLYLGSYPKRYRKLMIPTFTFKLFDKVDGVNVGFCNLSGYKHFSRYCSAKRFVDEWAKNQKNGQQKILVIYALTHVFTKIAAYIKKEYKNIKVCIIVPDLPEFMRVQSFGGITLYRVLKKLSVKISVIPK